MLEFPKKRYWEPTYTYESIFNLFLENATLLNTTANFNAEFDAIMADTEAATTTVALYTPNSINQPGPTQEAPGNAQPGEPATGNSALTQEVIGQGVLLPCHGNAPAGIQNNTSTNTQASSGHPVIQVEENQELMECTKVIPLPSFRPINRNLTPM